MSAARTTFLWMAALSALTLGLGMVRELVIAQQMQASGTADLFFRGVVVVAAARNFTLALLRARWIPLQAGPSPRQIFASGVSSCALVVGIAVAALAIVIPRAQWWSLETLAFALSIVVGTYGAALRALSERHGHEKLGVVVDWLPPLGTIAGTLWIARATGSVAQGAIGGLAIGLLAAALAVAPSAFGRGAVEVRANPRAAAPPGWSLYVDTLVYVNLGIVDTLMSMYVFDEGEFALLNYGFFFVNAILVVPTTGATILALRAGGRGRARDVAIVRRWAVVAAVVAGVGVLAMAGALAWAPIAGLVDGAAGWPVAGQIDGVVIASAPFAALRLANTIGRQHRVARDPDGLIAWDLTGLALRTVVLGVTAAYVGPVASPLGLAVAEAVQLGAWWRWRAPSDASG